MGHQKVLVLAAIAVGTLGSANAAPLNDFTVDPTSLGGNGTNIQTPFVADKITGNYNERITFDGAGGFAVSLYWNAGQFVKNDGATPLNGGGANGTGLGNNYGLYAVQTATGTVVPTGGGGAIFTVTFGTVQLWYDDNLDTTLNFVGVGGSAVVRGAFADDKKLADATITSPSGGVLDPTLATCIGGINCGSFGQATTFTLTTPEGDSFFTLPSPFYNLSFQSGQLNSFALTGTQDINGSLDVVFEKVPEPSALALVGLALTALGWSRRRAV